MEEYEMKKWLKSLKKDERGLTLVELLAVVVILAIVAAIAFVSIGNVIDNSKKDAHIANAQQIIAAAKLHEASTDGDMSSIGVNDISTIDEKDLIDPWEKKEYSGDNLSASQVTKNDDEYSITFNDDGGNCKISATEQKLRKDDREVLCKSGSSN